MTSVHFSRKTDQWATPQALFDAIDSRFGFTLDACADEENAKCADYYDREADGLAQEWGGTVWCNPPYGRQIGDWVRKAAEEAERGAVVVALVPARVDTKWWNNYAMRATEVYFFKGRIKFEGGAPHSAPFPSALLVFAPPLAIKATRVK